MDIQRSTGNIQIRQDSNLQTTRKKLRDIMHRNLQMQPSKILFFVNVECHMQEKALQKKNEKGQKSVPLSKIKITRTMRVRDATIGFANDFLRFFIFSAQTFDRFQPFSNKTGREETF